jgi:hypothetical protein
MHPTVLQQIVAQHVNDLRSDAADQRLIRQLRACEVPAQKTRRRWAYPLPSRRRGRRPALRLRQWAGLTIDTASDDEPAGVQCASG